MTKGTQSMSLMDSIIESTSISPPKLVIYGEEGVGKTTLAARAEAIVIDCEAGAGTVVGLKRTPYLSRWVDQREWLFEIARDGMKEKVLAIDTLDWMIQRIIEYVVMDLDGDPSMTNTLGKSHGGYAKGREVVQNIVYRELIPVLNKINDNGVALLLLAHAGREESKTPEGFDRSRAVPDIPSWVRPIFTEWCDAIFYINHEREVTTESSNLVLAKNRYQLPAKLPLDWSVISQHIGKANSTKETNNGQS